MGLAAAWGGHSSGSHDSQRAVQEQWKYSILMAAGRSKHGWSVGFQEGGVFGGHLYSLKKILLCWGIYNQSI